MNKQVELNEYLCFPATELPLSVIQKLEEEKRKEAAENGLRVISIRWNKPFKFAADNSIWKGWIHSLHALCEVA